MFPHPASWLWQRQATESVSGTRSSLTEVTLLPETAGNGCEASRPLLVWPPKNRSNAVIRRPILLKGLGLHCGTKCRSMCIE